MTFSDFRAEKEIAKLEAETREIEARLAAQPSYWDKSKEKIVYFTALLTLFAGGWEIYQTTDQYFRQREQEAEQAEKAYAFNVNKELILLSQQMASAKVVERNNAVLLLSGFEEDAVPILVANLGATDRGNLPQRLISALDLVLSKIKSKDETKQRQRSERIMAYIAREAEDFIDTQHSKKGYDLLAMKNYIDALGKLGAKAPGVASPALERIKTLLADQKSRITPPDRETLESWIANALSQLPQPEGSG